MATILLTVAGSIAGNAILPRIGGALLGSVGAALGRTIDTALFGQSVIKGPRLDSLKVQDSSYGNGIPVIYGTVRVSGNVIWSSDLIETLSTDSVGGKGVGGTQVERASYAVDCAIALGFGPVGAIRTIWADSKEVYSAGQWKTGTLWDAEFYTGTTDQAPSPLMESTLGAGNVPAYKNIAYVVLHRLQLGNFGNRIPNFTFEVAAFASNPAPLWLGEAHPGIGARADSVLNPLGLPPVPLARRGEAVTQVLIGGFSASGGEYAFTVVGYDLTGDVPVEISRATSAFTALSGIYAGLGGISLQDIALGANPSGQKIAFAMQFGDLGTIPVVLALYDVPSGTFGALCVDYLGAYEPLAQIAWLDEQRFVIGDVQSGLHGARIYAAAGVSVAPLGFFNVWGADSSSRQPLAYAQFAAIPGGLFYLTGNVINTPTTLYGRGLVWQDNALTVGSEQVLTTGMDSTSTMWTALIALGGGEYVLSRSHSGVIELFSFIPGFASSTITRNWTSLAITPGGALSVNGGGGRLYFLHQSFTNSAFRYGEIGLTPSSFTLDLPSTVIGGSYSAGLGTYFTAKAVDADRFLLLNVNNSDTMVKAALFEKAPSAQGLDSIAADLLIRGGYQPGDYDVSALTGLSVDGYAVAEPAAVRAMLEPLQAAFGFDLIESDGELKAKLYTATADATLDDAETRAAANSNEPPPRLTTLRAQELDLPREVVVNYIDPALDYQKGSQRARRITSASPTVQNINLPLVCSADDAEKIAEVQLFRQWAERSQISFTLSRAYTVLDPGDVVALDGRILRLTGLQSSGGLIKAEGLAVDGAALSPSSKLADGGQGVARNRAPFIPTTLFLMDLPLLRTEDDQPGFYASVSGREGWRGAALYRSPDGVTYTVNGTFTLPATCGLAATSLPNAPTPYMDRVNTVNVALLRSSLSSCGEIDLLNGANAALLGNEIIQFQNAVLNSDGSYTLSLLLRGRRGTENMTSGHVAGERFVLLQNDTVRFLPLTLSDRGRSYDFRATSTGQDVSEVTDAVLIPQLETIAPFSPEHLCGARNAGGDVIIGWKRRARLHGEWVDLIDVPLDEDAELYDVEILNGGAVVRTFSSVSGASATYLAADQTTDFGATQTTINVKVYQLSARYGRGAVKTGTV